MKHTLFLFIIALSFSCSNIDVNEYYIDSENGNDGNDGNSPKSAWQSLEKVNQTVFEPGDKIQEETGGKVKYFQQEIIANAMTGLIIKLNLQPLKNLKYD
jgi:hypothetical protein